MIRTGKIVNQIQGSAPIARRAGNNLVVREAHDCAPYSRVIRVQEGDSFRLTAYNLCEGTICIDKVVLSTPVMDTIPCCSSRGDMGPEMSTPVILHRKPAMGCSGDTLTLNPEMTEVSLEGPGHYQLVYQCVDGVYIEGRTIKNCCEATR